MNRRSFLKTTAAALLVAMMVNGVFAGAGAGRPFGFAQGRPNIIIIYVDDLAYGDVGAFGCPDFATPSIDRLAENGVRCTHFYTANSPCSPSRSALMMGMYTQRFGKYGLSRGLPLPEDKPTLAETLRDAGYVTGFVGTEKWDIGCWNQGALDEGFMEIGKHPPRFEGKAYFGGGSSFIGVDGSYLTEVEGQYAVEFIERHGKKSDKPFFLYFTPLAVHKPCTEVPEKYLKRLYPEHTGGEYTKREYLGAALLALDDQIGRIWKKVNELGIEKQTLIIFSSDNRGDGSAGCRNAPFRGGKNTQWEGNMRVPTIFTFPGTLPKGKEYKGIGSTLDFYATAVELAQTPRPDHLDGKNLISLLQGQESPNPNEMLFWDNSFVQAVRWQKWRMTRWGRSRKNRWHLYDIVNDPGENADLAKKHPEIVQAMEKKFKKWLDQMSEPGVRVKPPKELAPHTRGGNHARRPFGRGWMTVEEWDKIKDDPTQWSEVHMRQKMLRSQKQDMNQ